MRTAIMACLVWQCSSFHSAPVRSSATRFHGSSGLRCAYDESGEDLQTPAQPVEAYAGVSGYGLGLTNDAVLAERVKSATQRDAHRELFQRLSQCFVLIFDAETEHEGIYCVEQDGVNIVLGFECEKDAGAYAHKLQDQGFFNPQARPASIDEMIAFCWESNGAVKLKLVAEGTRLVPPVLNQPDLGPRATLRDVSTARQALQRLFDES